MFWHKTPDLNETALRTALHRLVNEARIDSVSIDGVHATIILRALPDMPEKLCADESAMLRALLSRTWKSAKFTIAHTTHRAAPELAAPPSKKPSLIEVTGVKKIIAVASGKGGVGKSTIAMNIACAMAKRGLTVGLLDADIYGPSVPKLMGLEGQKPKQSAAGKIVPLTAHKVRVMSIGFMVDAAQALIWRGPMVQSAFKQLLSDVDWGGCDVLILDTPPGTGDVQLTLAQSLKIDGAVIVSTPQELALADARKGVAMFQKLGVPILGVVENMAGPVFGEGGAEAEALKLNVPFLGRIPLDASIREAADAGRPIPELFEAITQKLLA